METTLAAHRARTAAEAERDLLVGAPGGECFNAGGAAHVVFGKASTAPVDTHVLAGEGFYIAPVDFLRKLR